ncbi:MAG: hypothetical protein HYV62_05485 [Candidatus Rokubacteria bacterium]|nr:hypothetical protein [Candidatus Rokubacteria bacterium]
MSQTLKRRWNLVLASLLVLVSLGSFLAARSAEAQTFTGVQGDRHRIYLGFQVKPDALQAWLPAPWQLNPIASGPLKGANFQVVLLERVRDDDPDGKPKYSGTNRVVAYVAPAKHPQTGTTASMIVGGYASNPAYQPGFYKVFRAATVRVEHAIKSHELDAEEITDVWEVRDATGAGGLELRLESLRKVGARTRSKGEPNVISAKEPALWRIYKFDTAMDVVKSAPEGIDRVQKYAFRLTDSEFGKLFDGSERLVGIFVQPWYVRQVFVK